MIVMFPITNRVFQAVVIAAAFLAPLVLILLPEKWTDKIRRFLPFLYVIVILYLTLFSRRHRMLRAPSLIPFVSYQHFDSLYARWQVYMNVLLFIPFGFLVPFSSKRTFIQTLLISCCLSAGIEAIQYFFSLGLCETDDVIHNTLGCVIGYLYWIFLSRIRLSLKNKNDKTELSSKK